MKKRIIRQRVLACAAVLGIIGTMFGCAVEGDGEDASVKFSEDTLTEGNNASEFSLAADRVLAIKLDGRPAIGSAWKVASMDDKVIRLADTALDGSQVLGGTDKQVLRFVGVSKGTTTITLEYGTAWDKTPEKTYSVKVNVAGAYNGTFQPAPVMVSSEVSGTTVGLPSKYSTCDHGGCTPVKSQGSCGSCWAFATAGVVESAIALKDKVTRDVSEEYLLSCNNDNWSCQGGYAAFAYFTDKVPSGERGAGAVYESDFPYTEREEACNGPHQHHEKMKSWGMLQDHSVNAIKQAILDHGAVWVTVCADGAFSNYSGGIFGGTNCTSVNHAVVLVGWDDNGGNGYWIMRNSWGDWWGEKGYMRIRYGANMINETPYYVDYGGGGGGGNTCPVQLFADPNYGGKSTCLNTGRFDIDKLRATVGNDTVSSVKVASGYRATLYAAKGFLGGSKVLTSDTPSLPGFNDVTSSVVVEHP